MAMKQVFLLIIFQGFYLGCICQKRTVTRLTPALLGSCVEIPCTHRFQENIAMSGVVWFTGIYNQEEILNTKNLSSVSEKYRNRTSLVPGEKNCTLRIEPVRKEDVTFYYSEAADYRRIHDYIEYSSKPAILLFVIDYPENPEISVSKYLMEDTTTTIQCAVNHTCGSSPPSLQWNKPGQIVRRSESRYEGLWREESELTYFPSYGDDGTPIRCTATYPNGQKIEESVELKIHFAPKFVTVTFIDNGKIMEGSDVILECNSVSRPGVNTYEWYKGRNRTKLPNKGYKMMVKNVTRDEDLYSCAAINDVGREESSLTKIHILYEGSSHSFLASSSNIILVAVCVLLLALLVYFIWRDRCRKVTTNKAAESPDATYSDLIKKDIDNDYEDLRTRSSTHITLTGRH